MLNRVEVITAQGTKLVLPLPDMGDGFVVKEIGGLNPVKASIVSSSVAQKDGTQYQSSRREARNITMKLGLGLFYRGSARTLRKQLYGFLMPQSNVLLRFIMDDEDDEPPVEIRGKVEGFESDFFTKEPEVDISIMCFDPNFIVPEPVVITDYANWDPEADYIDYEGSVETGIQFRLEINRDVNHFTIENTPPDGIKRILEYSGPMLIAGDVLDISTVAGNKYVMRTRAGKTESILYAVTPYSDWVNLYPGLNDLRFMVDYVSGYLPMAYRITYITQIGGL